MPSAPVRLDVHFTDKGFMEMLEALGIEVVAMGRAIPPAEPTEGTIGETATEAADKQEETEK